LHATGITLTEKKALHIQATTTFKDKNGVKRLAGDVWLVKHTDTEVYILGVYEKLVAEVELTTLTSRQYCYIENPVDDKGKNQFGIKKLVQGEINFFL